MDTQTERITQGTLRTSTGRPLPLEHTDVKARIAGPLASIEVRQLWKGVRRFATLMRDPMPRTLRLPSPLASGIRGLVLCLCVCAIPARAQEPERLEQDCTGGKAQACDTLGDLYDEGRGVPKDERRAASLYEQACRGGVPRGCNNLGILYQDGRGVDRDDSRAAGLYEEACDAKYANACTNLGLLHQTGRGVTKDAGRAVALFTRACEADRADACALLATLSPRTPHPVESARLVEPEEPKRVFHPNEDMKLHLFFALGGQAGGETLLEVYLSDGTKNGIGTGSAFVLTAGAVLEPMGGEPPHFLQLQATGAFNIWGVDLEPYGTANWTHGSLELLAFYVSRPHWLRVGGGFQLNTGILFEGTGTLKSSTLRFDDAVGLVAQAELLVGYLSFYLRYTSVAYKPEGLPLAIPANSVGFGMSCMVPVL